jgi:hypothetical protein
LSLGIYWPCAVDVPALELALRVGGGDRGSVNMAFSSALSVNPAIPVKPQSKSKRLHAVGGFEYVGTVNLHTEVWGPEEHHHFHLPFTDGILSWCPPLIKT